MFERLCDLSRHSCEKGSFICSPQTNLREVSKQFDLVSVGPRTIYRDSLGCTIRYAKGEMTVNSRDHSLLTCVVSSTRNVYRV